VWGWRGKGVFYVIVVCTAILGVRGAMGALSGDVLVLIFDRGEGMEGA